MRRSGSRRRGENEETCSANKSGNDFYANSFFFVLFLSSLQIFVLFIVLCNFFVSVKFLAISPASQLGGISFRTRMWEALNEDARARALGIRFIWCGRITQRCAGVAFFIAELSCLGFIAADSISCILAEKNKTRATDNHSSSSSSFCRGTSGRKSEMIDQRQMRKNLRLLRVM